MFCASNEHIRGVCQVGDYYVPTSEMLIYGEVYNSYGNQVIGNNQKVIQVLYAIEGGYNFYGCDGERMYLFNEKKRRNRVIPILG